MLSVTLQVSQWKHALGQNFRRQFTFSVGYKTSPPRARLGFGARGKAGARTPALARALLPRSELAGGGRAAPARATATAAAAREPANFCFLIAINTYVNSDET